MENTTVPGATVVPVFTKLVLRAALKEECFQLIHGIVEATRAGNVARARALEAELARIRRRLRRLGGSL